MIGFYLEFIFLAKKSQNYKNMLILFCKFMQKIVIKLNITGSDLLNMVYFSIFGSLKSQEIGKISKKHKKRKNSC